MPAPTPPAELPLALPTLLLALLVLTGCQPQELLDQNAKLQQQIATLTAENAKLAQDNEAMRLQLRRLQSGAAAASGGASSVGSGTATAGSAPGSQPARAPIAHIQTSFGQITCRLRADEAPDTVANFVGLARGERAWVDPRTQERVRRPFYDGLIFHRVSPGFMIQGGDPLGTGAGGPGYTFKDEVGPHTTFDRAGLLAMANAGPDTNGSQFFLTDGPAPHLNGRHTIFGDCDGLDVISAIARAPAKGTRPLEPITMKVRIE